MKILSASLLALAFLGAPSLAQGFSTSASVSVFGTGLTPSCTPDNPWFPNPPGVYNLASLSFESNDPITTPGNPGYLVQSCGLSNKISLSDSYAKTVINTTNGHIGVGAYASSTGGYGDGFAPGGQALGAVFWQDTVYLTAPGIMLPDYLDVQYVLDGLINGIYVEDGFGPSYLERVEASFTVYGSNSGTPYFGTNSGCVLGYVSEGKSGFGYTYPVCGNQGSSLVFIDSTPQFEATIVDRLPLLTRELGAASYFYSYGIGVSARATSGYAGALLTNTLVPKGIYLPDGSTPESQGWSLALASGINSPNLSTQPVESAPTPLPLIGVGAGFGWSRRIRRQIKRNASNCS